MAKLGTIRECHEALDLLWIKADAVGMEQQFQDILDDGGRKANITSRRTHEGIDAYL